MGRKTTKGGRYMNPTDQERKRLRDKEKAKNKVQREKVRELSLRRRDPYKLKEEVDRLQHLQARGKLDKQQAQKLQQMQTVLEQIVDLRRSEGVELDFSQKKPSSSQQQRGSGSGGDGSSSAHQRVDLSSITGMAPEDYDEEEDDENEDRSGDEGGGDRYLEELLPELPPGTPPLREIQASYGLPLPPIPAFLPPPPPPALPPAAASSKMDGGEAATTDKQEDEEDEEEEEESSEESENAEEMKEDDQPNEEEEEDEEEDAPPRPPLPPSMPPSMPVPPPPLPPSLPYGGYPQYPPFPPAPAQVVPPPFPSYPPQPNFAMAYAPYPRPPPPSQQAMPPPEIAPPVRQAMPPPPRPPPSTPVTLSSAPQLKTGIITNLVPASLLVKRQTSAPKKPVVAVSSKSTTSASASDLNLFEKPVSASLSESGMVSTVIIPRGVEIKPASRKTQQKADDAYADFMKEMKDLM